MLTIIHGEDTAPSRNYYIELKHNSKSAVTLNGTTITSSDLTQSLSGDDLFGTSKDVFIEELLSKRKASKELDSLLSIINSQSSIVNVFLWESKSLTKRQLDQFKDATASNAAIAVKEFKIPSTIFTLLDNFKPGNGQELIKSFHQTLKDKDAEFVFFMLTRLVRTLLAIKENAQISEISRLAPWQKGKLDRQAKSFTTDQLIDLHSKLYAIEVGLKTSGLTQPLIPTIDFLLAAI